MRENRQRVTLVEREVVVLARDEFPQDAAETLWRRFGAQVSVDPPSFKTGEQWRLTAQDWVGFLPVSRTIGVVLQSKVPLKHLFEMLTVAYDLHSLHFFDDLIELESVQGFYEQIAMILARRVLECCRRGIYRTYQNRAGRLPFVRGTLQMTAVMQQPWQGELSCLYSEQTADVEENQILGWTLHAILRSGLCTERSLPTVRRAYRALQNAITLRPFDAQACLGRTYSRLNHDYRTMHALCYFFLDQKRPEWEPDGGEEVGNAMLPFMVHMPQLYERVVARWLKANMDPRFRVQSQERLPIDTSASIHFEVDLAIYDLEEGSVRWVIDTKYKNPTAGPATADVQQVIAYAHTIGAPEAILLYPQTLSKPLDREINGIRVRSLAFALDRGLDRAGEEFLRVLIPDRRAAAHA